MLLLLLACVTPSVPAEAGDVPEQARTEAPAAPAIELSAAGVTVSQAFPPPEGATRVATDAFGASLLELPLREASEPVRTYDGRSTGHHARVIDMPLVPGDLQQCADSILRVRAEWLRDQGEEVSFYATSGDPLPWSRWQAGERPYAPGNKVLWKPGTKGGWDEYLAAVFNWAGTVSLQSYETVAVDAPRAGDILVEGGFPGHAVLLLDVATRGEETFVLVGEGFMPAQSFHVELGPHQGWWRMDGGLALPVWSFEASHLRRWKGE